MPAITPFLATLLIVGAAGAGFLLIRRGAGFDPVTGQRYAEPTTLDSDGTACLQIGDVLTPIAPADLAAGMDLDPTELALARMVNSEFGRYRDARIGAAWCARNMAAHRGQSVLELLTRQRIKQADGSRIDGPGDGFFGSQRGRYASTAQNSSDDALEIARGVLSGELDDPTGGARQFDSPGAFGAQAGTDASDADTVAQSRIADGNEAVYLPGVPETYARFWRPVT